MGKVCQLPLLSVLPPSSPFLVKGTVHLLDKRGRSVGIGSFLLGTSPGSTRIHSLILLKGTFFFCPVFLENINEDKKLKTKWSIQAGQPEDSPDRFKRGVFTLHSSGSTGPKINPINYYHPIPRTGEKKEKNKAWILFLPLIYLIVVGVIFQGEQGKSSDSLGYEERREAEEGGNAPHPGGGRTWNRGRQGLWDTPG